MGCHFLAQVKGNCSRLLQEIALFTALTQAFSTCEYFDNQHGYAVHRRVELYDNKTTLPEGWNGIVQFAKVRRWGSRNGKTFDKTSYYVLSKKLKSAYHAAQAIQGHWSVENNLHWMKDVNMGEDQMSLTDTKLAAILACFNNATINILHRAGYKPTKDTFAYFANKIQRLYALFNVP